MPQRYVPGAGDIVWLNFTPQAVYEQAGHRPALVLSPAAYNGTFISGPNPATAPQNKALRLKNQNALVLQTHDVGHDAAEPTLGVDPKGAIFYAAAAFDGINGEPKTTVLRSTDGGLTWQNISPSVGNTQTQPFTLDPYLYVDPIGRVFTVDMLGAGSYLSFSDDQGQNWTTTALTIAGANDHQRTGASRVSQRQLGPGPRPRYGRSYRPA